MGYYTKINTFASLFLTKGNPYLKINVYLCRIIAFHCKNQLTIPIQNPTKRMILRYWLLAILSIFLSSASAQVKEQHWGKSIDTLHDSILTNITGAKTLSASLPQRKMSITSFGARQTTTHKQYDCKLAFDKAMRKAAKINAGLHIIIPQGDWFV